MKRLLFTFLFGVLVALSVYPAAPTGYYDAADGKSGAELKTAMHQVVRRFINLDFDGFTAAYWGEHYFKRSDWHADGYYWDMYSSVRFEAYDSGKLAREHCMPRSWWKEGSSYGVANGDLNNLFPAETTANGKKSNLPLGETAAPTWTNDVVKIGPNAHADYTGKVFEPAAEYKGDFARTYMYMVTCYEDYADRWKEDGMSMLDNAAYPVFKPWAKDMLLRWHKADPVDEKERQRNDSVFLLQQNRNPFIDYPDLAEYVWGDKAAETFAAADKATRPLLITPSAGVSIDFGNVMSSNARTRSIPVKGALLSARLTVDFLKNTSEAFSADTELPAADVNSAEGYFLPVTYKPTATRKDTAVLRINGADLDEPVLVTLYGNGVKTLEVLPVEPTDDMDVMLFYTGPWAKADLPDYMSTNAAGAPYANGDFSFRNKNEYLMVTFDEAPGVLQFSAYPRNAWGTNDNHLYVYEGVDADHFAETPIADFDNTFMQNESTYNNTPLISLREDTRAVKIVYAKKAQNVGINNLIITRKGEMTGKAPLDVRRSLQAYCADGMLHIAGTAAQGKVQIYAVTGELVAEVQLRSGGVSIPFGQKGVFLLRSDSMIYKFISR